MMAVGIGLPYLPKHCGGVSPLSSVPLVLLQPFVIQEPYYKYHLKNICNCLELEVLKRSLFFQVAYDVFTDLCEDCEWLDMLKL